MDGLFMYRKWRIQALLVSDALTVLALCPKNWKPAIGLFHRSSGTAFPWLIGSAVGGTASAFYGFNHAMPVVQRYVKGPMWLHFLIGAPPVIVFSSACAGLSGGAIPALAQLVSSSYHAAISSSLPPPTQQDDKMHKSRTSTL
ncbi:uncharacterized protein LOC122644613 isoform X1 [Telopea speciosissima]|uniref:uncharacterized protein LOC122644613 isoform X1 n=1 Tax=Telopea speciosissima TaxID=54955 RepID=UPI001CC6D4DE|nr:uncharacterized protein LOC122644613 isoform X1 [Telopea speciosissima]